MWVRPYAVAAAVLMASAGSTALAQGEEGGEEEMSSAPGLSDAGGGAAASPDAAQAEANREAAEAASPVSAAVKNVPTDGPKFDEYRDIAKDLRCPTCTGLSVLESDAKFSQQIKDIVKEQVTEGKTKDEIYQYFTERYGPWILRAPPKSGFNLLAWLFPISLLLAGPPLVWFFVWRKRKVITTMGVRVVDDIISQMHGELDALRAQGGGKRRQGSGGQAR
jgi:cytochrome c-type biogenesis protein CcmH